MEFIHLRIERFECGIDFDRTKNLKEIFFF